MIRLHAAAIFLVLFACGAGHAGEEENPWRKGFWKSRPAVDPARAEFNGQDPYALAIGVHIKTPCTIYVVIKETDKLYCFNSLTSKAFFLKNPEKYIRAARAFLASEEEQDGKSQQP